MRTTVAIIEVHPETIRQDYQRVLRLGKLDPLAGAQAPALLLGVSAAGFQPGWSVTPWQVDALLGWLGEKAAEAPLLAVGETGVGRMPADALWQDCLTRHRATEAARDFQVEFRPDSDLLHPALDAVLPHGVQVPVGLAKGPALLVSSVAMRPEWGVGAASVLLRSLVTGGAGREHRLGGQRKAPAAEIIAEAVGVAREIMPGLGVVVDGTLWGVWSGPGRRGCVARNVLLAGTDPVAVDAVAMRLAGLDPGQSPWLRICHERGFGRILPTEIRIVGRQDLLNLDFGLLGGTFAARQQSLWSGWGSPLARWWQRARRQAPTATLAGTAWELLSDEYIAGREPLATEVASQN